MAILGAGMRCVYCSKPLPAGRESCHVECMHELLCRRDARRCIGCGKADVVDGSVRCAECVESERFGYWGYPGAAARRVCFAKPHTARARTMH